MMRPQGSSSAGDPGSSGSGSYSAGDPDSNLGADSIWSSTFRSKLSPSAARVYDDWHDWRFVRQGTFLQFEQARAAAAAAADAAADPGAAAAAAAAAALSSTGGIGSSGSGSSSTGGLSSTEPAASVYDVLQDRLEWHKQTFLQYEQAHAADAAAEAAADAEADAAADPANAATAAAAAAARAHAWVMWKAASGPYGRYQQRKEEDI
jgi:pyruvate/2-oxoglutarate dehydrogenase complex dihydrolipoamide acyltransferase (E2) component